MFISFMCCKNPFNKKRTFLFTSKIRDLPSFDYYSTLNNIESNMFSNSKKEKTELILKFFIQINTKVRSTDRV